MTTTTIDYAQFRGPVFEERLVNPNDFAIETEFGGIPYRIPARNEHWIDPVTQVPYPEPGVMPLRVRGSHFKYEFTPDSAAGRYTEHARLTLDELKKHLMGEDNVSGKWGAAGVRYLHPTDQELNSRIREDAEAQAATKEYADACYTVSAHEEKIRAAKENKEIPPTPTPKVRRAYAVKSKVESGMVVGLQAKPYSCPKCFDAFAQESELVAHVNDLHPLQAEALLGEIEHEAPKAKRGRPKKQPEATA